MPTLCEAAGAGIPHGSQGRSLWPLLQGKSYPQEEFRSIYAESGFGGLHYTSSDHLPFSVAQRQRPDGGISFDGLNPCSQSGYLKMVRMGRWKLLFDMMGTGELYDLERDPHELENLFDDPSLAAQRAELLAELLRWTIRTQDTLPTARYPTKWAARNWYAP
jgi:arylsulfatase A-like enzyme